MEKVFVFSARTRSRTAEKASFAEVMPSHLGIVLDFASHWLVLLLILRHARRFIIFNLTCFRFSLEKKVFVSVVLRSDQ